MTRLFIVEQSALAPGGHYYAYTRSVAQAAVAAGLDVLILENKRFKGDWQVEGVGTRPAFTHTWGEAEHLWIVDWTPGNLAYEFVDATRGAPSARGDHVLFHTLSFAELRAVLEYLAELPITGDIPYYHLLLRYDPDVILGSLGVYKPLFDRIGASPLLRSRVLFHTDTDQLSHAYSQLTGSPFTTLPIPFLQDQLRQRLADLPPKSPEEPVTVIYLGDARLEKNYASLPTAVAQLWPEFVQTGLVRFVLQSNFNTPGGEAGVLAAVQRLGQFPPKQVELLTEPLSYAEYYDRLAEADAVVIPYDPVRYRSRSSGILVEAMAAGKPVVTTAGSWMASQVDDSHAVVYEKPGQLGDAFETLFRNFEHYRAGAEAIAAEKLAWSSGANFVQSLIDSAAEASGPDADGPRVLVVMDGDAMVLRNGASKVAESQFNYLRAAGYRVSGLFMTNKRAAGAEVEAWTRALRERVAGYGLDHVLIADSGRLSSDVRRQSLSRTRHDQSIANDLDRSASMDFSSETIRVLRQTPIDIVLLNYITAYPLLETLGLERLPLICETHDIQAFQKAIYGHRAVRQEDLDLEFSYLARADYLISLNAVETAYLQDRIPGVPVITSGIFPKPRPISAALLAGPKSLGELISSCGPENVEYQWEGAWREGKTAELDRLVDVAGIDLVYVSSNHLANASGLRWFLEKIYGPYLAPAGISLVVAGSIDEVGGWPEYRRLFFVGRLSDLDPLYAAAKIVVLPITEGAGGPVKTFEALSYGRPIVATTVALRGIEGALEGVVVADEAPAFTSAVIELLASPKRRRELGAQARATSERISDPGRYAALMNEAFAAVLGDAAPRLDPASVADHHEQAFVEWGDLIRSVNRLVRSWLDREPLDPLGIKGLKPFSDQQIHQATAMVVEAVIQRRTAPLLRTESRLLQTAAMPAAAAQAADLERLIDIARQRSGAARPVSPRSKGEVIEVVGLLERDLDFWTYAPGGARAPRFEGATPGPTAPGSSPVARAVRAGRLEPFYSLGCTRVELSPEGARPLALVATQTIAISGDLTILGEPVVSIARGAAGIAGSVLLMDRDVVDLHLPRLFSTAADSLFVDLVFVHGEDASVDVRVEGHTARGRMTPGLRGTVHRFKVDASADAGLWSVRMSVTAYGGAVTLLEARLALVCGDDAEDAMLAVDEALNPQAGRGETLDHGPPVVPFAELAEHAAKGTPLRRDVAVSLRASLSGAGVAGSLSAATAALAERLAELPAGVVAGPDLPIQAARVLWPKAAMQGAKPPSGREAGLISRLTAAGTGGGGAQSGVGSVFSSGLSVEVHADYADPVAAARAACTLDEQLLGPGPGASGATRVWRKPGSKNGAAAWLHRLDFQGGVAPSRARLVLRLPAGQDNETGRDVLAITNTYPPEMLNPEVGQVWTGPNPRTVIGVPVALTQSTEVVIDVSSFGAAQDASDVTLTLNDKVLEHRFERTGEQGRIVATYQPDGDGGPAVAELEIFTRRVFEAPGDPRRLGLAINAVELRIDLQPAGRS